jgi:hypothetical protein
MNCDGAASDGALAQPWCGILSVPEDRHDSFSREIVRAYPDGKIRFSKLTISYMLMFIPRKESKLNFSGSEFCTP